MLSISHSLHRSVELDAPRKISLMMEPSRAMDASSMSTFSSTPSPSDEYSGALFSSVWRPSINKKAASRASCWRQLNMSYEKICARKLDLLRHENDIMLQPGLSSLRIA